MGDSSFIRCSGCGAQNRVPAEKIRAGAAAVCGKCRKPLSLRAGTVEVSDSSFGDVVLRSSLPVLVDMWAPWCGPCRMVTPVVEALAGELAGRMVVAKLNVDENPITSAQFQIQSIPALLVFRDGREVDRMVGALPKAEILRRVERVIS